VSGIPVLNVKATDATYIKNSGMRILIILVLISDLAVTQNLTREQELKKLSWLEGTWNRTNVKIRSSASERWVKTDQGDFQGWGVTMSGSDTSFVEKLKIIIKDNEVYYVADVPDNKELTYFKFIELTATGFICENPEHDFPKKISYQLNGSKLKATISGNGKSIDYFFERKN
jgi:hypothetical protein